MLCGVAVLVTADRAELRELASLLRDEGLFVVTASSAPECLLRAAAQRPEVVIVDLALCGSQATLVRGLVSLVPGVSLIVTSDAPVDDAVLARFQDIRARILTKPYTAADVVRVIEQVLMRA